MENGTRVKILHRDFCGLKGKVVETIHNKKKKILRVAYVVRLSSGQPYTGITSLYPNQVKVCK